MTTHQAPIPTGFTADTTASEVMAGVTLSDKTFVLTGGYSGVGLSVAQALVGAGASLIVPARRPELAKQALADMPRVTVVPCDLADPVSVAEAASTVAAAHGHLAGLVGCAAIMACPESRTAQGWELQLATNHFGHAALIVGLWPLLCKGQARVVLVSSGAHWASAMRWEDPHFTTGYERWSAYGQSKTANALTAVHLDAIGAEQGVRALSVHPGSILTPLQRHLSRDDLVSIGWVAEDGTPIEPTLKTPEQGAATVVLAAASPLLAGRGGVYCMDGDVAPADAVAPHACDPAEAARLWQWTERTIGMALGA